jgi:uncharacterized SAM-binding protein YcdF (DUF218 family)
MKALLPLFFPLGLSILLVLAAILSGRRPRAMRLFCLTALALLLVFASPSVADALMRSLEDVYPDVGIEAAPKAEALVVLGGAVHIPNSVHTRSALTDPSDRVLRTARLYRAGKAPLVLCSGGNNPVTSRPDRPPEARIIQRLLEEWGVPAEAILVEDRSVNTRENALFSFAMLRSKNIRHILLITSATHMPRALSTFKKVGFEVSPAPADFRTGWGEPEPIARWIPGADSLALSDLALKEWLGRFIYRIRGWV